MNNTPYDAYDIVFDLLIENGYSESEAEHIICQIILDQKDLDNTAERIHNIIQKNRILH